jgi:plasmid maintenance system antidote protein VapI
MHLALIGVDGIWRLTFSFETGSSPAPCRCPDRTTLSKVLNGRAAISPSMALRIERWLGRDHGGAAEVWLAQQAAYDLWQARVAAKASKTLSGIKALRLQTA